MYTVLVCICICSALPFLVLTRFFLYYIHYYALQCTALFYTDSLAICCLDLHYYATLCYAVLCCAVLCCAMPCYAMLCYAMLCYAMHITFPGEPSILQRCVAVAKELHIHPPARWGGVHHTGLCPVILPPPPHQVTILTAQTTPAEITFILVSIYKVKHQ